MLERLRFYTRHSLNDLRVNRQRTLFALLCIAAGVAAMVSMQTLGTMINTTLTENLQENNRGDLRAAPERSWGANTTYTGDSTDGDSGELVLTPAGVERIRSWLDENYPGSEMTYQQASGAFPVGFIVNIAARDTYKVPVFNFIVNAQEYPLYGNVKTGEGKALKDLLREPTDIVLSRNLADDLEAQVGDIVTISGANKEFTVTGIVPTDSEAGLRDLAFIAHLFGYYYLDQRSVSLFNDVTSGQASHVYIRLADPSQVDSAKQSLNRMASGALNITSTTDIRETNKEVSDTVDDLVVIMGLVSLLIGGIGIVNTMMVIVSRRTTEVAILKTLGLEPREVTWLFLVEAILMGIIGSLVGVVAGWALAYGVKGIGENFLGQRLSFVLAISPALNGFVVGVAITAIFGFLPTLAAGKIRPANVLRPNENVIPRTGRLNSFVAVAGLIMALSVVAQGLMGDLLEFEVQGTKVTTYTAALGGFYGALIAVPVIISGILDMHRRRRGRRWILRALVWILLLGALPALGAAFGYAAPALIVLTATAIITGYLYLTLWMLIWAVGGGSGKGILDPTRRIFLFPLFWPLFPFIAGWMVLRHRRPRLAAWALLIVPLFWPVILALILWRVIRDNWPGILILLFPLFWPLIPALIVLMIPTWILGALIQNFTFVDFKIAMRSMLSTRARGASTLLALVVGVFTLSVITMLVDSITSAFEELVNQGAGGNLFVANSVGPDSIDQLSVILDEQQTAGNVRGFSVVNNYDTRLDTYFDASAGQELGVRQRMAANSIFSTVDGRDIASGLPDLDFDAGRNLNPALDSAPDADGYWSAVAIRRGEDPRDFARIGVGDRLTVLAGDDRQPVKLVIVGIAQEGFVFSEADVYAPRAAFGDVKPNDSAIIADVPEGQIREVRRALIAVPGTIVLETRIFNDLVNSIVNQFTSLPILVAALALVTGGIVIANAVALSTMERRREIGIMKAVGVQRERVLGMLMLENGLMGIVGGLIGVGISFVAIVLMLRQLLSDQFGNAIPYMTAFTLMALCILISLGAALLTVWGASGEKPLNILRYE
jgi:ABC-type antimicrobial peptide transport system permease subunit